MVRFVLVQHLQPEASQNVLSGSVLETLLPQEPATLLADSCVSEVMESLVSSQAGPAL